MPKITDQLRAEAVAEYLRGTTTQEEFCTAFQSRTGHPLSPRTLRSWTARFDSGGRVDARVQALLAEALDQVRALEARLQAVLDQFDGVVAAPVPDRHVGASHAGLPPAVALAGPLEASALVVTPSRAAAAELSLGSKGGATTEEPAAKFTWDWD
ncbi:helix-turn-helix domain-containing protein [Myxococcus sp. MxC21-1]|uniref:helix-turn-helix domain-containing protein n=1 Tax=Myxococcus sp. MxC21-1 TaxID=3041439 RepID=UPI00292DED35|nr:helix-turn-helix domain-containing protein [Myxococcus sp. MxC21-1]WNZ59107.1 helix-turn-helix domain-containing protein [Myxococcus sp. MxC21-1]